MPREQPDAVIRHLHHLAATLSSQNASDADLLERFVSERDEAAFAALLERHGGLVWSVCRRILDRREDIEDAFQATFLVFIRKAGSVRQREALASWLYAIAYRMAMKAKKSAARGRQPAARPESRAPEQPPSAAALRELQMLLEQEIQRLPEKYRAPFLLCCLEGKTRDQVAQELGWKPGTVAGRLAEARKLLQQRLERRGVALSAVLCAAALTETGVRAAAPATLAVRLMRAAPGRAGETISAQAIQLARSLLRDMWLGKLALPATVFLALAVLLGSVAAARHALASLPQRPAVPAAAAEGAPLSGKTGAAHRSLRRSSAAPRPGSTGNRSFSTGGSLLPRLFSGRRAAGRRLPRRPEPLGERNWAGSPPLPGPQQSGRVHRLLA